MYAKKSLGQNFLHCSWALRAAVGAAEIKGGDTVLEIGPGKGALTEKLLDSGSSVVAVEKDDRLIPYLEEKFKEEIATKKLVIVHGDILEEKVRDSLSLPAGYAVVANIPYYITGQFMRIMFESKYQPSRMVLMLQKEVAQRIVANDGKESLLSISVKTYGKAKKVIDVPRGCFTPEPNVDSAILEIKNISRDFFKDIDEQKFFDLIHAGFAHKRKQLAGNLSAHLGKSTEEIKQSLTTHGISENIRAEELSTADWKKIVRNF